MSNDFLSEELLLEIVGRVNSIEQRLDDQVESEAGWFPVFLSTALTSTSFDGDSFSDTSKTSIDLSSEFSAPASIKAVLLYVECRDSGSSGTDCYVVLSPNDTANDGLVVSPYDNGNDVPERACVVVPCDSNGDIYYQIEATGTTTFDLWIRIWGYWK